MKSWKIQIKFTINKKYFIFLKKFKSYPSVFIGKINKIHILINAKSNREIPCSLCYPGIHPGPKLNRDPGNYTPRTIHRTLKKLYFQFLSHWRGYDRGDSFPFNFEPNWILFGSENWKENCQHDRIPFNVRGNANIVFIHRNLW